MKQIFNQAKWDKLCEPSFKEIDFSQLNRLPIKPLIALAVVNEIEKKAVLSSLKSIPKTNKKYKVVYKKQTYYLGLFGLYPSVVVQSGMGIDGPMDATLTIHETIQTWKINVVVAIGVAMGLKPGKHHLGDVLVSQTILNYNKNKVIPNSQINRSVRPMSSIPLFDRFKNRTNWQYYDENNRKCNVHLGLIITGGSVVDDPELALKLSKEYPDAIGNEMEASGVWAASEREDVHWIVVKGICDWGMGKTDDYQPLAASAAVSLCKQIFKSKTALSGIVKNNNTPKSTSNRVKVNSLKLYYYRLENNITTQQLALKTGISEIKLKKLESFNASALKFDHSEFPECTLNEIRKIERVICNGRRILRIENTSKDYMGYLLSYYFKGKLKQKYTGIKAIVFDFDGTLTKNHDRYSTWQKIWLKLGYTVNDCNELHERFSQNEFSHQEWCNKTCEKFQEKGMTNRILSEVANEISLIEGTIPTLKKMNDNNIHLFIASGSIRDVIIKVIGENNVHLFEEIKANRMEFDKNGRLKRIIGTKYDFDGKRDFVEKVAQALDINTCNILFVGNSNNDQLAYQSGAVTLCVNPDLTDPQNKKIWHNAIYEMQNLNEIMSYVDLNEVS
ncbi:HAD family hydrolase [Bacteroides uniformis]|jgi:nucleoside phosphorylase/phosphoserine phosphatase|uniref:Nucleoside phosphorylase domain-containing protein n=1 Tax=Barnesiella viscericola DSM 18177 TaxID=880074 RepID=W0EVM8_9BACT|nr:HAD family hydrolase [Barnesiella viscericola]AHF13608.1 hypothetical protein BARVI_02560 [Barnesiella viscericola DSM 18177]